MAGTDNPKNFEAPQPPAPLPFQATGTFRSLRHRNFQLYFGGQLISIAGTWMQIVAQGWLVYQISHSELTLGIVGFASAIPALIVAPFGGALVDRLPKRNLLIVTQAVAMLLALILAALAFSGRAQVWHVVALAAGLGLANAFDGPARQAFVVEMVGREDLTNAIALNSMMFNGARVIGPAIGGLLLATVGSGWCFLINGLSYIAVIAGLAAMKLPPHIRLPVTTTPMREMAHGLRYVLAHVEQFALLLLALIFAVFGLSYNTVLPAFATVVLRAGPEGYGLLNAATGLGAMAGALIIARTGGGRRGRWMTVASLTFPIVLLAFAVVTNLYLSLALALLLGLIFMIQFTLINTLLQLNVADEMRGRVLSLYVLTWFGFAPFGNLAMGNLAEHWGLSLTIGLAAVVAMVLAALVFAIVPRLRRLL
ncbi:MAG: MFS transporter [Anaerolineales bacterium]